MTWLAQFSLPNHTGIYRFPNLSFPAMYDYHITSFEDAQGLINGSRLNALFPDMKSLSISDKKIKSLPGFKDARFATMDEIAGNYTAEYGLHKWVYHEDIVRNVLAGSYNHIMPVSAEFIPSMNCLNRCGRCSYKEIKRELGLWKENKFDDPKVHLQDPTLLESILTKLSIAGIKGLYFTGGGEPTLSALTVSGISYATELGMDTLLLTSGSDIEPEQIIELCNADPNPYGVRISLNSGTQAGHSRFHRYGQNPERFIKTIQNIKLFSKMHKEGSLKHFGIAVLINETNYKELVETAETIADAANGGKIDFVVFRPEINFIPNGKQLDADIIRYAFGVISDNVKPLLNEAGIAVQGIPDMVENIISGRKEYVSCLAATTNAEVVADGSMYYCCPTIYDTRFYIGKLLNEGEVEEIYRGDKKEELQQWLIEQKLSVCPAICRPNGLNKVFNRIEEKRNTQEWPIVTNWINDLKKLPVPDSVNFV